MNEELEYWKQRCLAAEKTTAVLKSKVLRLNNQEVQSVMHSQLERARKREERNLRRQQDMERKAAEQLADAKERMDCALEGGKLAIWAWDLTTNRLDLDQRWYQLVHRNRKLGDNHPSYWRTVIHPEDFQVFQHKLNRLKNGQIDLLECEFRVQTDDGDFVWMMARAKAVELDSTGKAKRLTGTVMETTARKEAELNVQRIADQLQALFHASIDGICCVEDGVVVECNPIAPKIYGFENESELIGKSVLDFSPEYQSDGTRSTDKLKRVNREVQVNHKINFEWTHQRPDGSHFDVDVSLFRIENDQRNRLYSFVRDISERKELERQLTQSQRLESIGQLAAGVAHEINTPMQCIFSNVEYLERGLGKVFDLLGQYRNLRETEELPEAIQNELEVAERRCRLAKVQTNINEAVADAADGSRRVIEIVRAMKTMSHPGTVNKVATPLNDLIQDALVLSKNRWKTLAEMEIDLDESIGEIPLLPAQMSQVVLNLLVNATDAISDKLGQEPSELGKITVRSRCEEPWAIVEITDSGAGMSDAVQKRIFDPFFTTKEVGKGSGQGLAITFEVVRSHQGKITVDSEPGVGTTFRIYLPIDQNSSERAHAPVESQPHTSAR